jgi:hypothetical protein
MPSSNSSKSLLANKPSLFSPSVVRGIKERPAGGVSYTLSDLSDMTDTGLEESTVFKYDLADDALKSTQQLNIDWSDFANHTFYNSAQVKVNVAFDRILNEFPFDGSNKDIEMFLDSLTGYEKYVFDLMPKNVGYLYLSGTNVGEPSGGTYITVKDIAGAAYPDISIRQDGLAAINPLDKPVTVEYWINPVAQANADVVVMQKFDGANGFAVMHHADVSTTQLLAEFEVKLGSISSSVYCPVPKGEWSHMAWVWNRDYSNNYLYVYQNGEFVASSSMPVEFGIMDLDSDFIIGSGSTVGTFVPQTTFSGSIDDLRIWHTARSEEEVFQNFEKTLYPSDTLKAYFKFNEPSGSYSSVVVDASSNSLHGKINSFGLAVGVREIPTASIAGPSPVRFESVYRSPILFPKHVDVVNLTNSLLDQASIYDTQNPSIITRLVPKHYLLDGQEEAGFKEEQGEITEALRTGTDPRSARLGPTQTFLLLLYTWAKFFDEMKLYSQAYADANYTDYNITDTVPSQFLQKLGRSVGLELPPLFTGASVDQFINGENFGDEYSSSNVALKEIQNQIWRRILINYKDIMRSKGTVHSVKSFIRAVGIDPDNNFRIREYGGPTKRNLSYVRDKRTERATQLSFLQGGHIQSPGLYGPRYEPGFPGMPSLVLPIAEFDEDYVFVNNSTTATINFNFTFSTPPIFIASVDDNSVNVYGVGAPSTTAMTVEFSAPFTGFVHYKAAHAAAYPAYASSPYSPILVLAANTYTIGIGDLNTTHNVTYGPAISAPTQLSSFPIDVVSNNLANIGLSSNSLTVSNANILLSAPAPETRLDYIAYVNPDDALYPSFEPGDLASDLLGSWTYEGLYRFTNQSSGMQSLARLHTTGSNGEGLLINCIADESNAKITLFARPNVGAASGDGLLQVELENVDIFDGHFWHVSFGKIDSKDPLLADIYTTPSSSFFLRAARQDNGEVIEKYETSSYFNDNDPARFTNIFIVTSSFVNASGSSITIGSASIDTAFSNFLNDTVTAPSLARFTGFDGRVSNIKFWSRAVRHDEWLEHVRNYKSSGVNTPLINYNFNTTSTGSFERLRVDAAGQQDTIETDSFGNIKLFDYSQNEYHFSGTLFPASSNVLIPETLIYSYLSPKIDAASTTNKVRVRSYLNYDNVVDNELAQVAPVYDLLPNELPTDNTKFTIDYSITDTLDEDIISMFGTYKPLDDIIGSTELLYSPDYPGLENLRDIYFNRLTDKVNAKAFFDFYKWFDTNIAGFVEQLLPRKVKFMGANFVLESSVLERPKIEYQSYEQYLGDGNRGSLKDSILLSFFEGTIRRY